MATQKPIISVVFDEKMLKRIEDFQFTNRLGSRSKAVNELVKMALDDWETMQPVVEDAGFDPVEEMEQLKLMLDEMHQKMIKHRERKE
jgi:Arc/MetJ-type ribon-helix-helix transcriptional regulator